LFFNLYTEGTILLKYLKV